MTEITKKQVCTCENCGNEAEMLITCRLEDGHQKPAQNNMPEVKGASGPGNRVKAKATCSHCGNEADIWIDL